MHEPRHGDRLTPNQVIAHNLRAARTLRGLTQTEAATRLEPFLGERWSVAVFSAAERSVAGKRVRVFDADTIHAFARAFELPIGWFFLPPNGSTAVGVDGASFSPAAPTEQATLGAWVAPEIHERVNQLARELPASERGRLIRSIAAAGPGGFSESALVRAVVDRLKAELETLEALTGERTSTEPKGK